MLGSPRAPSAAPGPQPALHPPAALSATAALAARGSPILIALAMVAIAAAFGWVLRSYQLDDPYITYRYAANLAAGRGLVYNEGERVLATTSPLFAIILGGLGRLGLDIPTCGFWIGVLALGAGAYLLYRIGRRLGRPLPGALGAILYLTSADALLTLGLESTLYLALALGSAWAAFAGRSLLAGLLLGLATLARGDAVVLGVVLLAWWLLRRRSFPGRAAIGWCLATVPWAIGAWLYFGWPLPVTLTAKVLQGRSSFWEHHFWSGLGPAWSEWHAGVSPLFWWLIPLVLAGLVRAARRDRDWLVWPAWGALYVGAYSLLDVPSYYWHYAPIVPAVAALAGLGGAAVADLPAKALRRVGNAPRAAFAGLAVAPIVVAQVQVVARVEAMLPLSFFVAYQDLGRQLAAEVPPGARIGTLEVGLLGYHSGRTMIDFAGLLQPPIAHHVAQDDFAWAVEAYRPEYVVWSPGRDRWLDRSPAFSAAYEEIRRYPNAYLDPLIISRRRAQS